MKKCLACVVLSTLVLATGCNKLPPAADTDSDGNSPDSVVKRIDKHGDEIMASSAKAEAREWMKQPKHVLFKADPKQVAQFVEDFYQAGAVQVLVAEIEEHDGIQIADSLLVVLPTDPAARAKIFTVESRADAAFQDDPVPEKGQKYLYNSFD